MWYHTLWTKNGLSPFGLKYNNLQCTYFGNSKVNDTNIVKSGTDFRNLSKITIKKTGAQLHVDIEKVDVTSDIGEDSETLEVVRHLQGMLKKWGAYCFAPVRWSVSWSICRCRPSYVCSISFGPFARKLPSLIQWMPLRS